MTLNPSAIVTEKASLRIAKQEAGALWKRIKHGEKTTLLDMRELGLRLANVRAAVSKADYVAWYQGEGIPQQRVSEALKVAANWGKEPERGSLHAFLKALKENVLVQDSDEVNLSEIQATEETAGAETEAPAAPVVAPVEVVAASAAPDIGDAAEEVPEGLLVDPEGDPLPDSAKEAIGDHPVLVGWCERLHGMLKELDEIVKRPSKTAAFVDVKLVMGRIRAGYRMAHAQRLTADRTYRCEDCKGAGGECKRCEGVGFIPETRRGDQWSAEPKPKKPFNPKYRRR